jgi:hypothetical protein
MLADIQFSTDQLDIALESVAYHLTMCMVEWYATLSNKMTSPCLQGFTREGKCGIPLNRAHG